ncbi:MAG TPA: 3-hydroxyacyl-CoA dehydrogenase family protein [Ruminiclostridium sp.]|nr:3-hydroxyacyl-CoA dehydrogenase family protein [Ruminiclostridium sp.]
MKVGVIGAGVMGTGVAQNLAQSGYQVVLIDICKEALESAGEKIRNDMRLQAMFSKNREQPDIDGALSHIVFSTDYELLKDVDFVIENVTEKWDVKKEVYKKIDSICPEQTIFLVNTSCISITKVGALTNRKEKVIGTHFMNPVPMKNTIETIRGYHTSEETIEATRELLRGMGKECVIVNDYPGFVSNRISHLFMNEAAFVVQDQVASPEEVDDIFKLCFGHKMGPLETADLIGLDTVADSLDILYQSYQDPKFRCCPLLRKMVDAGLLGRKAGQGFYTY